MVCIAQLNPRSCSDSTYPAISANCHPRLSFGWFSVSRLYSLSEVEY